MSGFALPLPSHPGVGQFTPSNFIAVAAATAALCCSIVPPFSNTLILFLFAIGHPDALQMREKVVRWEKINYHDMKLFFSSSTLFFLQQHKYCSREN
jgi:hypothetical protein